MLSLQLRQMSGQCASRFGSAIQTSRAAGPIGQSDDPGRGGRLAGSRVVASHLRIENTGVSLIEAIPRTHPASAGDRPGRSAEGPQSAGLSTLSRSSLLSTGPPT